MKLMTRQRLRRLSLWPFLQPQSSHISGRPGHLSSSRCCQSVNNLPTYVYFTMRASLKPCRAFAQQESSHDAEQLCTTACRMPDCHHGSATAYSCAALSTQAVVEANQEWYLNSTCFHSKPTSSSCMHTAFCSTTGSPLLLLSVASK